MTPAIPGAGPCAGAACREGPLAAALHAAAADERPAPVALMHLLIAAGPDPRLPGHLEDALRAEPPGSPAARRLTALRDLLQRVPDAPAIVAAVMAEADHTAPSPSAEAALARWALVFDRLAARAPRAGVALYALGDEGLLVAATNELTRWLAAAGLLGPHRIVLDLGCGTGRLAAALAPRCALVVGADLSEGMLRAGRCNVPESIPLVLTSGRDLAAFACASFDLVVACDLFPYLVQAGGDLALRHVAEVARILRPGGEAVAFNLSYRGDPEADLRDAADWARAAGLALVSAGDQPLCTWDARIFRWQRLRA